MKLFIAVLAVLVIGVSAANAAITCTPVTLEGSTYSPRVCFPKENWGPVPARVRPCVKITNVLEDGSFEYAVSDGDGTVRYTAGVGALDR